MKGLQALVTCFVFSTNIIAQPRVPADSSRFFVKSIVTSLPDAEVYFIGQLHGNEANNIMEKEFLFLLNEQRKINYDLLEYSHSTAVIINEYLQTGNDSLLASVDKEAGFKFIRSIKAFNDSVGASRRIKFYGIDFEGRDGGRHINKAMSIILREVDQARPVYKHLKACEVSDSASMKKNLQRLKKYLEDSAQLSRKALGTRYIDACLIANAQFGFSPNRDYNMYKNFKFLYEELSRQSSTVPRFLASFGMGHIDPRYPNGIVSLVSTERDSPVQSRVTVIGVHYVNCRFMKQQKLYRSHGILGFVCKKKMLPVQKQTTADRPQFRYMTPAEYNFCHVSVNKLAGIILIENFKGTSYWTWE